MTGPHDASAGPGDRRLPLGGPRVRRLVRRRPLHVSERQRRVVVGAVLVAVAAVLLVYFRPGLLLSTTTPTGGDTGAHIYTPWYLRTELLPDGRLSGWSPDWYGGFPVLQFYFPLVMVVQALLSYVIPYGVAFKLGTVIGTFFLPVAVYLFLRLLRLEFPTPVVGAAVSVGFLFLDSFTIYGGNIPSTLAGEYSFSLSLGLMLVVLGLLYRLATGDDGRPLLAAGVLAAAVLTHLVPVIMVVLCTPLLAAWAVRTHGVCGALRRLGGVFGLAFAVTAVWSVPFLARLGYTADMHWTPLQGWGPLFPREVWVYLAGAALAAGVAALRRDRRVALILLPGVLGFGLYFGVGPGRLFDGAVWSGRFLPFWYLSLILATAYVAGTTIPTLARLAWRRRMRATALAMVGVVAVAALGVVLRDRGPSYIDDWIRDNYGGYESARAYPTFRALMDRIDRLPPGRVMWEPSPDLVEFGTPIALMTIPHWTDHPTMEGIYFESSVTTPFHFLTAAEVAEQPSNPIPGLPYSEFDMDRGVEHLRLLDVSYFLSVSDRARRAASETAGLEHLDDVGDYSLFAVDSPGRVVVPRYEPVVLTGGDWIEQNVAWFSTPSELEVPMARDGPDDWARVSSFAAPLPRTPVEGGGRQVPARVDDEQITFTTDAVGQPHWIKTSHFPNWEVDGAAGPYRASPSMMVVVPTQREVRLRYGRTWPEWTGLGGTLVALVLLAVPPLRRRVRGGVTGR